jgi:hypothetical protein
MSMTAWTILAGSLAVTRPAVGTTAPAPPAEVTAKAPAPAAPVRLEVRVPRLATYALRSLLGSGDAGWPPPDPEGGATVLVIQLD